MKTRVCLEKRWGVAAIIPKRLPLVMRHILLLLLLTFPAMLQATITLQCTTNNGQVTITDTPVPAAS